MTAPIPIPTDPSTRSAPPNRLCDAAGRLQPGLFLWMSLWLLSAGCLTPLLASCPTASRHDISYPPQDMEQTPALTG